MLRDDPRAGTQRRRRNIRRTPCLRRRGSAIHARPERQRRGGAFTDRREAARTMCLEKMSFIHIDSNMVPYISPEEYDTSTRSATSKPDRNDLVDDRCLETTLHLLGQVRRQPHGGGRPLRRGRRTGGPRPGGAVRRDPCPRLADLLRRHRRQTRIGQAAGRAHARHGVRPQR